MTATVSLTHELKRVHELRCGEIAAKRRKNAAHGASRGFECTTSQPWRGERKITGPTRAFWGGNAA